MITESADYRNGLVDEVPPFGLEPERIGGGCTAGVNDADLTPTDAGSEEPFIESGCEMNAMEQDMREARRQVLARCFGSTDCWVDRRHTYRFGRIVSRWQVSVFFDGAAIVGDGEWLSEAVSEAMERSSAHVAAAVAKANAEASANGDYVPLLRASLAAVNAGKAGVL